MPRTDLRPRGVAMARRGARGAGRAAGVTGRAAAALAGVLLALTAAAAPASAQLTWESPRLLGTEPPRGLGVHWVDYDALAGDGTGVLVTWTGGLPDGVRLRGGWGEGAGGVDTGFGGIDVWSRLTSATDDLPVDILWTSGIGASVGDWTLVSVPVGLTAGASLAGGSVWLNPYVHAGVVFDYRTGDEAPGDEFEIGVATDLGIHVSFDPARRVVVSASAGLGDRQAVAIGVVLRP